MIGEWTAALEATQIATALRNSVWSYPLVNTAHILGVTLLHARGHGATQHHLTIVDGHFDVAGVDVIIVGAGLAGLVMVTVNPAYRPKELAYVLRQSQANTVAVSNAVRERIETFNERAAKAGLPDTHVEVQAAAFPGTRVIVASSGLGSNGPSAVMSGNNAIEYESLCNLTSPYVTSTMPATEMVTISDNTLYNTKGDFLIDNANFTFTDNHVANCQDYFYKVAVVEWCNVKGEYNVSGDATSIASSPGSGSSASIESRRAWP